MTPSAKTTASIKPSRVSVAAESAPPLNIPEDMSYYDMMETGGSEMMEIVDLDPVVPESMSASSLPDITPVKKARRSIN